MVKVLKYFTKIKIDIFIKNFIELSSIIQIISNQRITYVRKSKTF